MEQRSILVTKTDSYDHFFKTRVVLKPVVPVKYCIGYIWVQNKNQIAGCITNFNRNEIFGDKDIAAKILT